MGRKKLNNEENIKPLRDEENPLEIPDFPITIFPKWLQTYCENVAHTQQVPTDMVAMMMLSCFSTACMKKISIEVSPNWKQDLNLYLLTLAPSGTNKSGVVKVLRKPITDYEENYNISNHSDLQQKKSDWRTATNQLKEIEKELAKPTISDKQSQTYKAKRNLLIEQLNGQEPTEMRLLCDDATIEVMAKLMHENGGKLAMIEAEGHGFIQKLQGQYSGTSNLDLVLKSDEDPTFRVDRINSERKGFLIKNPRMTIGLACQPSIFKNLKQELHGTGLFARFLISNSTHKFKARKLNNDKPDELAQKNYERSIKQILTRKNEITLKLAPDAYDLFNEIFNGIQNELFNGDLMNEPGKSFGGKLAGRIARIIGIVHMMEQTGYASPSTEINLETVAHCQPLVEYFISHKLSFHANLRETEEERLYQDIMKKIIDFGTTFESGKNEFDGSAFYQKRMRRLFPNVNKFKEVLQAMQKKGLIHLRHYTNNKYTIKYNLE